MENETPNASLPTTPVVQVESINQVPAEEPPRGRKIRVGKKVIFIFLALIFIFLLGGGGVYAYNNIYLSPKRVMGKMYSGVPSLKAYKYSSLLDFVLEGKDNAGKATLSLKIDGEYSALDKENFKHEFSASGYVNDIKLAEVDFKALDKSLFARVNYLVSFGYKVDNLKGRWVEVNFDEISKRYLGESIEILERKEGVVSEDQKGELIKIFQDNPPIVITEKLPNDKTNGKKTFHYKFNVEKENLKKFLMEVEEIASSSGTGAVNNYEQDINKVFDDVSFEDGEIWVGTKDYFPYRLKLAIVSKNTDNFGGKVLIDLNLSEHNKDFSVEKPSGSMSLDEFLNEVKNILENPVQEENKFQELLDPIFGFSKQMSQARDTQRKSDLLAITNALYQYVSEHNGNLPSNFPIVATCIGTELPCFDLASAGGKEKVVPTYLASMPFDPSIGNEKNTGYTIYLNNEGRVTAAAKGELTPELTVIR